MIEYDLKNSIIQHVFQNPVNKTDYCKRKPEEQISTSISAKDDPRVRSEHVVRSMNF